MIISSSPSNRIQSTWLFLRFRRSPRIAQLEERSTVIVICHRKVTCSIQVSGIQFFALSTNDLLHNTKVTANQVPNLADISIVCAIEFLLGPAMARTYPKRRDKKSSMDGRLHDSFYKKMS